MGCAEIAAFSFRIPRAAFNPMKLAIVIPLALVLGACDIDPSVKQTNSGTSNLSVIDTVSLKPLGVNGTGHAAHSIAADPTTDLVYVGVERAGIIAVYHDP